MKAATAALAAISLGCLLISDADTRLVVSVPEEVSRAAAARVAGDATAAAPILILDGVEVGRGEGVTFSVLSGPPDQSAPPIVLAVTGVVGRSQTTPVEPLSKMKLVVPLNERADAVLAGKSSVTLTLRLKNTGRPALRVQRAYFSTADRPN